MNIYFLVEGKRTEMKVYPKWLSYLVPQLTKVQWHHQVNANNYCIFTGNGFPCLLDNHLRNSVEDINDAANFDYFVICLDADEQSTQQCKQDILDFMTKENIFLNNNVQFEIIVQNKCFETWFLGNPKIFKQNPSDDFLNECVKFYNVKSKDPELMKKISDFEGSTSDFHFKYLNLLLSERNIKYTKKNPQGVVEKYYLEDLIKRNKNTRHIESFKTFLDFCDKINSKIQ